MPQPSRSFERVHYELRPFKQVERRMMFDVLSSLSNEVLEFRSSMYVGMGSVYFVDFAMAHRLLGVEKLVSVELVDDIENRVRFNRPYSSIDVVMGSAGDKIPPLVRDTASVVWLDFDSRLERDQIETIGACCSAQSKNSVFIATVDIEPPKGQGTVTRRTFRHFRSVAPEYMEPEWTAGHFRRSSLGRRNTKMIVNVIKSALAPLDIEFSQLFAFEYADTHLMLTVGGIVGASPELTTAKLDLTSRFPFLRWSENEAPYVIRPPLLTRRERIYMDSNMPCADGWTPKEFGLSRDEVEAYRETYRYLPYYAELMF